MTTSNAARGTRTGPGTGPGPASGSGSGPGGSPGPLARPTRRGLLGWTGVAGIAGVAAACTGPAAKSPVSEPAVPGSAHPVGSATTSTNPAGTVPTSAQPASSGSPSGAPSVPAAGPSSSAIASELTGPVRPGDWRALAGELHGTVLLPGAPGFAAAAHVYNTRFDAVVPAAVVRCGVPADVAAAVAFARRFGLRAVPRSGGHSYLGSSTVAAGLVIDTGQLAQVAYDTGSGLATIGAGARLVDVYSGLDRYARSIPAGSCPSVGMGGSALGGGLGVVSHAYGLTCDAVTAIEVVTADGRLHTVSSSAEPDLFWALRGGGGGTVGVATSFQVRPFPTADCGLFFASWPWSRAAAVVAGWQRRVASMPDSAWCNLHLDAAGATRSISVAGVSVAGAGAADLAALVAAVGVDPSSSSSQTSPFLHTMLVEAGCSRIGVAACHPQPTGSLDRQGFLAGSTVVGRALPAAGVGALLAAVEAGANTGLPVAAILDPLGGATGRVPAGATAFPWRSAAFSIQWYAGLATPAPPLTVARAQGWVGGSRQRLRAWSAGAYVNYPDASVTDPRTFHGATSGRLTSVLRRYDPDGFFTGPGRLAA